MERAAAPVSGSAAGPARRTAALAGAGAIAVGKINKKKLETEKERLLQQAIEKQNAIMFRIKAEVNAVQERADYLASLNTVLKLIIKDLKADLGK